MSSSNPVTIKFSNRAVRVLKTSISDTVLQEADTSVSSASDVGGIGYSVTCIVEVQSDYVGPQEVQDPGCFVHAYTSEDGSKSRFARIASIADMDLIPKKNSTVLGIGSEFRSNTFTIIYQDLDTAKASLPVITDRVSALYSDRIQLMSSFFADIPARPLPYDAVESSVQDSYVEDYKAKRSSREGIDLSLSEIQAAYSVAKEKSLVYSKMVTWLSEVVKSLDIARAGINDLYPNAKTKLADKSLRPLSDLIDGIDTNSPSITVTKDQLSSIKAEIEGIMQATPLGPIFTVLSGSQTLATYLTSLYLEMNGQLVGSSQASIAASTYENTYLSQLKESKQAQELALAAEAASLANISRYCPDIDTTTI